MGLARQSAAVVALLLGLTLVLTWPLARSLETAVRDPGDPLLVSWILAWDLHALGQAPARLFDANVFHPHRHALAYGEHLLGLVPLAAPAVWLGGGPVLAHNLVLVATFPLAGLTMFWLVRALTGHGGAAAVAAVLYAFSHYRFAQLSHLQLLSHQWLPLLLLALHRALATGGRWRDVGLAALAFAMQALSSGYSAYLALVAAGAVGVWAIGPATRPPLGRVVRRGCVAGVGVALVFLPLAGPYLHARRDAGVRRSLDEVELYAATPASYLAVPPVNRWAGSWAAPFGRFEATLFPGAVLLGLAVAGVATARGAPAATGGRVDAPGTPESAGGRPRRWPPWLDLALSALILVTAANALVVGGLVLDAGPVRVSLRGIGWGLALVGLALLVRRVTNRRPVPLAGLGGLRRLGWPNPVGCYVALTVVGLLCSFGPTLATGGRVRAHPLYRQLYHLVPGFDGLRVPARFALLVTTGLAVLAGFGLLALARRLPGRAARAIVLGGLATLGAVEAWSVPIPLVEAPAVGPGDRWLAAAPEPGAVVVLPMYRESDAPLEARRMLGSVAHWRPLVNGYSGFFPAGYWQTVEVLNAFPGEAALTRLRALGVRYVVLHLGQFPRPARRRLEDALSALPPGLVAVAALEDTAVVEVRPPP